MNLSPLEIRKQHDEFVTRFRGYDKLQVQNFLGQVAEEWKQVQEEQRRTKAELEELKAKLEHYQKVEEALQEALRTARENANRTQERAQEKASLMLEEAETRARLLVEEAEVKAKAVAQEAGRKALESTSEAQRVKTEAEHERVIVKQDVAKLFDRRNEIVARLRGFLLSEMELLARFEENDPIGYIKLLPAGRDLGDVLRSNLALEEKGKIPTADATPVETPADPSGTDEERSGEEPSDDASSNEGDSAEEDEGPDQQDGTDPGPPTGQDEEAEIDLKKAFEAGRKLATSSESRPDVATGPDAKKPPPGEAGAETEEPALDTLEGTRADGKKKGSKKSEPAASKSSWKVHEVVSKPADGADDAGEDEELEATEEVKKLRRILKDLS